MKINVEVECTPEEARRAMGLPDLAPVHERYIAMMVDAIDTQGNPEAFKTMLQGWAPMSEAGMGFWRAMFDAGSKTEK